MPVGVGVPLNLPKRSNVVSMWSFEGSGYDRSGQGNHSTGCTGSAAGRIGLASCISGGGTFNKSIVSGTGDFTLCFWYSSGNNGGAQGIFAFGNNTCYIYKNVSNAMYFVGGGATFGIPFSYDYTQRHFTVTRISNVGYTYNNGALYNGATAMAGSITAGGGQTYSCTAQVAESWGGHFCDEVIAWNVGLSAGDVAIVAGLSSYVNPPLDSGVIYF